MGIIKVVDIWECPGSKTVTLGFGSGGLQNKSSPCLGLVSGTLDAALSSRCGRMLYFATKSF